MPRLIAQAYEHHDAAKILLVKGATDHIARNGEILSVISEPNIAAMEAIGGTGDTITGAVAALVYGGLEPVRASILTARINRIAGLLCNPTPATHIGDLIACIPEALTQVLAEEPGGNHA